MAPILSSFYWMFSQLSVPNPAAGHCQSNLCQRFLGTESRSACMGPSEGGHHYLHCLHHSLASGQATRREHSPDHQQQIGLKQIGLNMVPPIRTRPSFPLSQSLPSASYPFPLEGRQTENQNHRKVTKLITWTTALSNSMKL